MELQREGGRWTILGHFGRLAVYNLEIAKRGSAY
jgi:hypothetical protein